LRDALIVNVNFRRTNGAGL